MPLFLLRSNGKEAQAAARRSGLGDASRSSAGIRCPAGRRRHPRRKHQLARPGRDRRRAACSGSAPARSASDALAGLLNGLHQGGRCYLTWFRGNAADVVWLLIVSDLPNAVIILPDLALPILYQDPRPLIVLDDKRNEVIVLGDFANLHQQLASGLSVIITDRRLTRQPEWS